MSVEQFLLKRVELRDYQRFPPAPGRDRTVAGFRCDFDFGGVESRGFQEPAAAWRELLRDYLDAVRLYLMIIADLCGPLAPRL